MASTTPLRLPWMTTAEVSPDDFKWELYNINEDFSQANNIADKQPDKLKELQVAFDVEAEKYNVYPLELFVHGAIRYCDPSEPHPWSHPIRLLSGHGSHPRGFRAFKNKSWTVAAEVDIPQKGASGVLATIGGRFGGWGLWLDESKPQFAYALSNQPNHKFRLASNEPLAPGHHVVRLAFKYDGGGVGKGGIATLLQVAQVSIPQTLPARFSLDETFDVGADTGTPIVEDYADKMPYEFTGTLNKLAVVLEPEKLSPEEQEKLRDQIARAIMGGH